MPHRGQELGNMSVRSLKLVDAWIQYRKELETLLQKAVKENDEKSQKSLENQIENAKNEIATGLRIAQGIGKEIDRDHKTRVMLSEAVKKVEGKTDKTDEETHE